MPKLPTPFGRNRLALADADYLAAALTALAHPVRLQLLSLLYQRDRNVKELTEAIGRLKQPTVSHHLAILARSGHVTSRRFGRVVTYQLATAGIATIRSALDLGGDR